MAVRVIAAVLLATMALPAHAGARQPAPLTPVLKKECGVEKNEPLAAFAGRPLVWCRWRETEVIAGGDAIAPLAGRRVYLQLDLDTPAGAPVHVGITMTSFGPTGQVKSHLGMTYLAAAAPLEVSAYVPHDAGSFYWTVSSAMAPGQDARVKIRDARSYLSQASFQPGEMCGPCRAYLDEALQRVRSQFLFADRLPMSELEANLRLAASGAQEVHEMDGVMKELARRLGEATAAAGMAPHGGFQTRAELARLATPVAAPSAAADSPAPYEAMLLDQRTGYLRLRTFMQGDDGAGKAYARGLRQALLELRQRGADRWIVDLREHAGGTMWPTIAALHPLLGNGAVGSFVDAVGKGHGDWLFGVPGLPPEVAGAYFSADDAGFDGTAMRTAVLFGPMTSSSGEMIGIAFRGRENTRSFGAPSAGYATVVASGYDRHGNMLGILSKYAADRNGKRVYPRLEPDVATDPGAALDAARAWLRQP